MKKILFLTDMWKPNPTANSVCVKNIAAVFKEHGWDVYVSAFDGGHIIDDDEEDNIKVEYIRPPKSREIINKSMFASNSKKRNMLRFMGVLLNRISRLFYLKFYPIVDPIFVRRWSEMVCKQIKANNIDVIVSVNAPLDSIATGNLIKQKNPNIKWVAYYIDGGSNYGAEQSFLKIKRHLQKKAIKWENEVLKLADKIIIMEGHANYYKTYLNSNNLSKMQVLNVPLFNTQNTILEENVSTKKRKEIWTYMGTIRTGFYDPSKFFKWFEEYSVKNNAVLNVYGTTNMEKLLKTYSESNVIKYYGSIPHSQVDAILKESDVLCYFRSERLDSVSGKFFEYLMYRKPIVYFGPFGDINWKQLDKYPLGIAINQEDGSTTKDISSVLNSNIKISKEFLIEQYYTSTPEAFLDVIDDFG